MTFLTALFMNTAVFYDHLKMESLSSPETPIKKPLTHIRSRASRL